MTPGPITITEETPLEEVVHLMETRRIKRLPVVRDGKVLGIVSRQRRPRISPREKSRATWMSCTYNATDRRRLITAAEAWLNLSINL